MENLDSAILDKIREQFDSLPYPQIPIDKSPQDTSVFDSLFIHNLVTPYYLRYQKVVDTSNKVILDAGCGSGYTSLLLAEANPGAKVVGVDLSNASIEFARLRLQYHGFDNVEFHTMPLEDIPNLGMKFDYVNCDDVLYLVPNPLVCLRSLPESISQESITATTGTESTATGKLLIRLGRSLMPPVIAEAIVPSCPVKAIAP